MSAFSSPILVGKNGESETLERVRLKSGKDGSFSEGWLQVQHGHGRDAVERVYEETLAGRTRPEHGHVLSLRDEA